MVKEVEIYINTSSVKTGSGFPPYPSDPANKVVSAFLTNSGKALTIDVHRKVSGHYIRFVHLWYALLDEVNNNVDYTLLESQNIISSVGEDVPDGAVLTFMETSSTFDISSVLTIPRAVYQGNTNREITLDLFTYEANITSCDGTALYGKKRLSVPYKATMEPDSTLATSTDGWYPIGVIDYLARDNNGSNYEYIEEGDVVFWYDGDGLGGYPTVGQLRTGKLYVALRRNNVNSNSAADWAEATEADALRMSSMPLSPALGSAAAVFGIDGLITRYIKKYIILDIMKKAAFKRDRRSVDTLTYIVTLREQAAQYMSEADRVRATQLLSEIGSEYNEYMKNLSHGTVTKFTAKYTF